MNVPLDISILYYKTVISNFQILSCLIKKFKQEKRMPDLGVKLNPGPYGYKLVCKIVVLNKHSWICNTFRYIYQD